jgi:LysR family nitrogen assimilation transcriptional regulator
MDLRHTRTFVTVAELGTVSKAALRLRIAQPALSRQISDLEQELGLKLFDRVGRRLLLTGEGEQLLSDCRGLLNYAAGVGERAEQLRRGDTGVLKVAATPLHIEGVLSQFLHHYAQRYPNVHVKVTEGSGLEILAMLERGEIHLGQMLPYGVPLDDGRFGSQPLEPAEFLAACHPSMTLGSRGTIEVRGLAPYPLLLLDGGYGLRRAFDSACRLAGLGPNIRLESRSPHTLLVLAEAGHGVAIIASTFRTHRYDLKIVRLTYQGRPLREPLAVLWDKRRPLPRYATAFCEMWAEHVGQVFPITRPTEPNSNLGAKRVSAKGPRLGR